MPKQIDIRLEDVFLKILQYVYERDDEYCKWHIGVCIDPEKRENDIENKLNITDFRRWDVGNNGDARGIKRYLSGNGFKRSKVISLKKIFEEMRRECRFIYVYKIK